VVRVNKGKEQLEGSEVSHDCMIMKISVDACAWLSFFDLIDDGTG
jgi:hypothetical protein